MGTITERLEMICAILIGMASVASATPATLNYQGRIIKSDGTPLEFNNVSFAFEITNASGSCIFYREQRDGVNMQGSKGVFDIAIGEGTKLYPATADYGLRDVFNNSLEHKCSGVATPYTPDLDEVRVLKVQFHDGVGWKAITPNNIIRSVPFASYSYSSSKLGDKLPSDFVLKTSFNSCATGQYLTYDGTNFLCKNDAGGAGMVADIAVTGPYLSKSGTASLPTVSAVVGATAGTLAAGDDSRFLNAEKIRGVNVSATAATPGQVLKLNGSNIWEPVTLDFTESQISGSISGAKISGDISGKASGINGVLPVSQGGTGSGTALNNSRLMVSSAGKIVEASALEDGQILIGKTGDAPQAALLSAGSGVSINNGPGGITISATGTGGTITSVNPGTGLSGGGSSGAVTLNLANTTVVAGTYGTATKVPQFAVDAQGRLTAVTELTISGVAPGGAAGGDLDGTYPNPDVVKLRGKAISATAPTATGQVLRYDGAQYGPNFLSLADIRSTVTPGNTIFPGSSCAADKTLNWSSLTDSFACQSISITESNISGTIALGKMNFGTQTAKTFLAAPTGAGGAPSFRTIAAADLPADAYDNSYFKQGGNTFGAAANLGTTDAQNLQFVTGGTARMALTTTGRLGIGTIAPASGLTLVNDGVGDANDDIGIFSHSATNTPALIMNRSYGTAAVPAVMPAGSLVGSIQSRAYNGSAFVEAAGVRTYAETVWDSATPSTINGALSIVTMTGASATEKMRVTSEGSIGVGVSVPIKQVHIQKDQATDTALLIRNASIADNAASAVDVEADGAGAQLISYGTGVTGTWGSSTIPKADSVMLRTYTTSPATNFGVGTGSAHPLHLVTDDTPRVTVTATGMVGVGLTSPLTKFTIADLYLGTTSDNSGLGISVYGSANDFGGLTLWDRDGDTSTTNDGDTTLYFGDDPTDNLRFAYKQSGVAMSEKMRLTSTGSLGIGTTNPTGHLHVSSSAQYTSIVNANAAAGGQQWKWLSSSTAAPLGANSMCFAIGVCYFSLYTTGNATLSGTLTQSSDVRFKKDIVGIDGALNDILKLRGVTYFWKDESKAHSKQMGLIAQEVEQVFPEVVETDAGGYKSVAYQNLVAPLIEAIKELHAKWLGDSQEIRSELSKQKREITSLKEDNERLRKKVEEIAVIKKALCGKDADLAFCKEEK
ncbi:tail fiber domain-containing protein [Bdellovibrio bacteriovorus]|uniref:tail fiber domain-containing protein n=1 Tax=Bdellovibrio bacteriovorus TaxID=959 RepID=UPI0021D1191D|nr:tail fiber domain-containing protein [Bdellovibrio bacteriovorus]UXR64779.1 tail fiber domain-containing protein [Bdellovibrio bacteriovorus]